GPGPRPFLLVFHPKGRALAVVHNTGVQVRDLETGNVLANLPHPFETWPWASWHPEGNILATVGGDHVIRLWAVATGKETPQLKGIKNGGNSLAFNHAGNLLASNGWEGMLRLWDPRTGKQVLRIPGSSSLRVQFSSDDRLLGPEVRGNKIRLWDL